MPGARSVAARGRAMPMASRFGVEKPTAETAARPVFTVSKLYEKDAEPDHHSMRFTPLRRERRPGPVTDIEWH